MYDPKRHSAAEAMARKNPSFLRTKARPDIRFLSQNPKTAPRQLYNNLFRSYSISIREINQLFGVGTFSEMVGVCIGEDSAPSLFGFGSPYFPDRGRGVTEPSGVSFEGEQAEGQPEKGQGTLVAITGKGKGPGPGGRILESDVFHGRTSSGDTQEQKGGGGRSADRPSYQQENPEVRIKLDAKSDNALCGAAHPEQQHGGPLSVGPEVNPPADSEKTKESAFFAKRYF